MKEDVIRSFAARVEMHCDSLVEEEIGSPEGMLIRHNDVSKLLRIWTSLHFELQLASFTNPNSKCQNYTVSIVVTEITSLSL